MIKSKNKGNNSVEKESLPKVVLPPISISEFRIIRLHDEKDVVVKFSHGAKIIVADNGSGKTTVLNALYWLLEGSWSKLALLEFSRIQIVFSSGQELVFNKSDFPDPFAWVKSERADVQEMLGKLTPSERRETAMWLERATDEDEFREILPLNLRRKLAGTAGPFSYLYRRLQNARTLVQEGQRLSKPAIKNWGSLKELFPHSIVYLPTYRRVEEDITSLGLASRSRGGGPGGRHIYFGMSDVRETFDRVDLPDFFGPLQSWKTASFDPLRNAGPF